MFIFESCHAFCGKPNAGTGCLQSETLKFWVALCELPVGKDLESRISVEMQAGGLGWLCNCAAGV